MKNTNKYIQFQVDVTTVPLKALFGVEEEEREATEEDIMALASALGG